MADTNPVAIIQAIEDALDGAAAVVVATVTDAGTLAGAVAGEKLLVRADGDVVGGFASDALRDVVVEAAREMFDAFPRVGVEVLYCGPDGQAVTRRHQARPGDARVMLQLFEAPSRLIVVGGGHVGLAVAELGETLGFGVTVVDDREEFANVDRFPMAERVCCGEIDVELDGLRIDRSTYVVLVSRGHRQDEIALRHVVGRGAAYVGMIGSKRRTATVLEHLMSEGFARDDLEPVATPIGLDIGAETPAEIAVSILAEITLVRRGGTGRRMSESRPTLRDSTAPPA